MDLSLSHFGNGSYRTVTTSEPTTLAMLEDCLVAPLLREAGAIIYRGFATSLEQMSAFVERHSLRVTLDPARAFHAKNVQKVDAGHEALGLHSENAVAPNPPDYIWFYCERAARAGSQTTVCDGVRVWANLSEETRSLFSRCRIKYARTFPAVAWKKWVAAEHPGVTHEDEATEEHLMEIVSRFEGQKVQPLGDGRVYTEFCVPALRKTTAGEWAFCNSLLGPSYNYEPPQITTDDGRPIPETVWSNIRDVTEALTVDIHWRDGDLVLLDNLRVMHGRRHIEDHDRRLYAALSVAR